jgi:hypothetical protein
MRNVKRHTTRVCTTLLFVLLTRCSEDEGGAAPLVTPSEQSTLTGAATGSPGAPASSSSTSAAPATTALSAASTPTGASPTTASSSTEQADASGTGLGQTPNSGSAGDDAGSNGQGAAGADGAGTQTETGSAGAANGGAGGNEGADAGGGGAAADGAAGQSPGSGGAGGESLGSGGATSETPGSEPVCERADVIVCEDFEALEPGSIPSGFTATGDVGVTNEQGASGTRALRVGPTSNGPRRITISGAQLDGLATAHWGRIRFKVQLPHPVPSSGVIHSTLVAGSAQSPLGDPIEVRVVDTVLDPAGNHQYLYNVQPESRAEFGQGSSYDYRFTDDWTCAEWHLDAAAQVYRFFVDGDEVTQISKNNGPGNYDGTEIPERFESLSFGWYNYQSADPGFSAWLDDIAVGNSRIGCTD